MKFRIFSKFKWAETEYILKSFIPGPSKFPVPPYLHT
jgi:hypothetical protein